MDPRHIVYQCSTEAKLFLLDVVLGKWEKLKENMWSSINEAHDTLSCSDVSKDNQSDFQGIGHSKDTI